MWWQITILLIAAYLLGGIPLQYLLGRLKGLDLRNEYDLHISLSRKAGPLFGFIGAFGDILKGIIVILAANLLNFSALVVSLAGLAAVTGQMWSVFSRFDGEKGNSIGVGVTAALAPRSFLIFAIPMATGALIRTIRRRQKNPQDSDRQSSLGEAPSNSLPIGMMIGFAMFPISTTALFGRWFQQPFEMTLVGAALFVLILIRRATAGIREDFKSGRNKLSIIVNRLVLDRGFIKASDNRLFTAYENEESEYQSPQDTV